MLVSHKNKFIYIKNRKVAGSSVEAMFQEYCLPPKNIPDKKIDYIKPNDSSYGIVSGRLGGAKANKGPFSAHMQATSIKKCIGADLFNSYFKFSVVRNPFDHAVSGFWHNARHNEFLSSWSKPEEINSKIKSLFKKWLCSTPRLSNWKIHTIDGSPICDFYIRYESLSSGINFVFDKLNLSGTPGTIPKFKSNFRKSKLSYRAYYDSDTIDIIKNMCKRDLDYFKYKF